MHRLVCDLVQIYNKEPIKIDYTTKTTIFELFNVINSQEVQHIFEKHGCNHYAKKLKAHQLIVLLILAQQQQSTGVRAMHTHMKFSNKLHQHLGIDEISHTQIFRRLQKFPVAAIEEIFKVILKVLIQKHHMHSIPSIQKLNLIDASTISKSLSGMEWAQFRKDKAGIKLHLSLMYHDSIAYPTKLKVTSAKEHDVLYLRDLVVNCSDTINVFDRGYVDYQAFDEFAEEGIKFVTRLKDNAATWIVERFPTAPESNVIYDDHVKVGNGAKKTRNVFRYIQLRDDKGKHIQFITNVMDQSAEDIGAIYKNRWQIELFFKWIKQNLSIKHFYATSKDAITVQVYVAMIAYCLFTMVAIGIKQRISMSKIKAAVLAALYEPLDEFIERLMRISPH